MLRIGDSLGLLSPRALLMYGRAISAPPGAQVCLAPGTPAAFQATDAKLISVVRGTEPCCDPCMKPRWNAQSPVKELGQITPYRRRRDRC